ncbi:MAG TPA: transketolase, partial [Microscillaceae bacterium]|nr:transketolase [Microscillaceae bacterium]
MAVKELSQTLNFTKEEVLQAYQVGRESREVSLIGRKEVFAGKAKFGIFGDGKEVAQLAMAKVFEPGDFRSGYYRDQTFMLAIDELTLDQYFAQLYAHTSIEADPASAGRMMNGHFGTRLLHDDGSWKVLSQLKNSSSDISPTAGQMLRLLGLAYASKLYRQNPDLHNLTQFSVHGNEVSFGTIGNASTSEGIFFETINAAGVLQVPMLISVWDDEYGISVPKEYHTTKGSISEALRGFQRDSTTGQGYEIFTVKGWDYQALCETYQRAAKVCREQHVPVLVHVVEMTQPQGHSTSGSHERYKSKERLEWEKQHDCLLKMRQWILENEWADEATLEQIDQEAKKTANKARENAWKAFNASIKPQFSQALDLLQKVATQSSQSAELQKLVQELKDIVHPIKSDTVRVLRKALRWLSQEKHPAKGEVLSLLQTLQTQAADDYNSHLYSQSAESALLVPEVKPVYAEEAKWVDGREVLQACFDAILSRDPRVFAIGEDVGKIGDVNQAFAGLQEKHGELRVTDTSIREATIIGQGIGAAMRGLRPIT